METIIIGSGKSLFSARVFLHRLGLTTTNTRNLALQTIRVRPSCKRYVTACRGGSCRFRKRRASFLTCSRGPCDGRRGWNVNETTSCFRIRHISVCRDPSLDEVTKRRRHGRDRGETDSCARPAIPIGENRCSWSRTSEFSRRMTRRIPTLYCCAPTVPPRARYRKCLHNNIFCISRGQDAPRSQSDENERR